MNSYYEVKIKRFCDGTIQYRASLIYLSSTSFLDSPGNSEDKKIDPVRSLKNSYKRTIDILYDILHSNEWEYFFTLTLDKNKVYDRYDFNSCATYIHRFTDLLYRSGCLYVIVPERHKDGAWHFHGLLNHCNNLKLVINDNGYFEFKSYHYGFCSLDRVIDSARAGNYILKYMIKGYNYLDIPKNKKRFWSSRYLNRPDIEYDYMTQNQIDELIKDSFYVKDVDEKFFKGYIINCKGV